MLSFTTFGLNVRSAFQLRELVPHKGLPDVVVRRGAVGRFEGVGDRVRCISMTQGEIVLAWADVASVAIREGREIVVDAADEVSEHMLSLLVLGPALGVLLHQRGVLTLHASVVACGNSAVAFIGWKGAGKSTTAASLCARGYTLLADDILAVQPADSDDVHVLPGFPQIKLWPDAAAALGNNPDELPMLHTSTTKRALTGMSFRRTTSPLRRIYVLCTGDDLCIEAISGQERIVELLRHSYAMRFLGTNNTSPHHFQQCVDLAVRVPVRRLTRPHDLDALDDLARAITHDLHPS